MYEDVIEQPVLLSPCAQDPLQQEKSISKNRYCGVNRRKCCTVASQAAIQPIMAEISNNSRLSSHARPCRSNVVPNTFATCVTTLSRRSTSASERISDSSAPQKPSI